MRISTHHGFVKKEQPRKVLAKGRSETGRERGMITKTEEESRVANRRS